MDSTLATLSGHYQVSHRRQPTLMDEAAARSVGTTLGRKMETSSGNKGGLVGRLHQLACEVKITHAA